MGEACSQALLLSFFLVLRNVFSNFLALSDSMLASESDVSAARVLATKTRSSEVVPFFQEVSVA